MAMPALSPTMEAGSIMSWEKKIGDPVSEGDLLCEIETDKATMGFESSEEGYLASIILEAGAKDIPVGRLLCIIAHSAEDVEKFKVNTFFKLSFHLPHRFMPFCFHVQQPIGLQRRRQNSRRLCSPISSGTGSCRPP